VSRTGWKGCERAVAKKCGGRRYPANMGGLVDVESDRLVVQVKQRRTLSLAQLEALVRVITGVARSRVVPKFGVVVVKRSARAPTPYIVALDFDAFLMLLRVEDGVTMASAKDLAVDISAKPSPPAGRK
jgi:hypothetical protein